MNKTLRLLLFVALIAITGNMKAQTVVTFDASVDKGTRTTTDPGEDKITKDGVTLTISNGCMDIDDHYRCYAAANFTISSTTDKIMKVEITCTARGEAKYGPGCFADPTEGTYEFDADTKVGTWLGNSTSFSLTATKQVRITKVEVTVGEIPDQPTFTLPEGQYFGPQSLYFGHELGCNVIYTINGDDPSYTDNTHYTGTLWDGNPLNISETCTVKAIAVDGNGKSSNVASASYTIINTQGSVTFTAGTDKGTRTSTDPGEDMITKDDVTISVSNGCMALDTQYRCYAGADITFASAGNNIVKVEMTFTAKGDAKYGPGSFENPSAGSYKADGYVGTWIGNAQTFTLDATQQARITKVVVTYSDTPTQPVFSIGEGIYMKAQNLTMSCGSQNFIIYTLNGDDPSYTDETHYTGIKYDGTELNIDQSTIVKAIAVSNTGVSSSMVTAAYTIVATEGDGTAENPFTVSDSRKVIDALISDLITPVFYTKGYVVSDVEVETASGQASFSIGDAPGATTNLMNVWKAKGLEDKRYEEGSVKIGDEVVICAQMQLFAGDYETVHGYIYSINGQTEPTAIQEVAADKLTKSTIYNVKGEQFTAPLSSLPRGTYIVNGTTIVKQ